MDSRWIKTLYITILCSIGYVATDIYLPSLPAIAREFAVGEKEVQATLAIYLLSFAFTPLLFGPLSDHFGRKKVIVTGLTITLFATIGCALSSSISMLILFRLGQGVGAGAVVVSGRATIADLFKEQLAKSEI